MPKPKEKQYFYNKLILKRILVKFKEEKLKAFKI